MLVVQWDPRKAQLNWDKHAVSFEEVASILFDDDALWVPDERHSATETRWIVVGTSESQRVLTAVITYRRSKNHEKEICRIISGRPASKAERKAYAERHSTKR
jgi:uncharacterized DUF497 family protein